MNPTATLRLPTFLAPLLQRLAAWWLVTSVPRTRDASFHTRDDAAALYARAAQYERTQPGFAADLRAAAEGMERITAALGR